MIFLSRRIAAVPLALSLVLGAMPALAEPTPSGAYLAARHASMSNDYDAARRYYVEALARDRDNTTLMENALVAFVGMGDVERSLPIARRLEGLDSSSQLAGLVMLTDRIAKGEFAEVVEAFDSGAEYSPLVDGLVHGWALLGAGRMSEATARFESVTEARGMEAFGFYHKALALAAVGDFEGADAALTDEEGNTRRISRSALIAHAQILAQLERGADAVALLDQALRLGTDPEIAALRERIAAGAPVAYDFLTTPQQGVAEVYFSLASAVRGDASGAHTLLYARLAQHLRPDGVEILLLVAELLESLGQHDLAVAAYRKVPQNHPAFYSAEIGRADALNRSGKPDAAIEVLSNLAKINADNPAVHIALGDALRREERFAEAARVYDDAIATLPEPPQANHWFVYYSRGISNERADDWDAAEADFRKALELSPDQPLVLNYLGYSMVEKRENLDEAQEMIEKAVAARPEDGYITDSLGWVRYRLGKFQEAVEPMERAVELEPVDPVVNDHLGDVYWMVGRKMEARFQWKRALSFDPEEKEAKRIRRKLEVGLDAVLKEEGERSVSQNGD
ncbi:hypothetical protein DDZ14_10395 [Maritimibacter sp. 55A14]|nr:tetratricopeptide repeat protein [Maritimibacter sp. 55A14]PWE32462.1 hypothetical protein DDZ14_10395 [Maritimibacter sp. 55A14]